MKIWEKFTGSYKPKQEINNTPKIKKNKNGSTLSITTTNRGSKKSVARLSFARTLHSRDKSSKMPAKRIKKMASEKIGIEWEDSRVSSVDMMTSKFHSGFDSTIAANTAKNTIQSSNTHTLERNNSSSTFWANTK